MNFRRWPKPNSAIEPTMLDSQVVPALLVGAMLAAGLVPFFVSL